MQSKVKYKALVTGGTRGIGFEIARKLIQDGMDVWVTGTHSNGKGPPKSHYIRADFLDSGSRDALIGFLTTGKFDVLVNNAGINKIGPFASIDIKDFEKIIEVNLKTPFLLCQAVIPYMKKNKYGRIVNITSIFGHISKELRSSYSASKFGLDGMTAALAAEVSEFGIMANCVAPGFIDTELTKKILGMKGIKNLKNRIPIKRLGRTREIAALVSWMASEENTYLSGQQVIVDGGFSRV